MIGWLKGRVRQVAPGLVIVDVGGVGYEVAVPPGTIPTEPEETGELELYVHTHLREDELTLYGFASRQQRELFRLLIGVSGVGPRLALSALSALGPARLVQAVRREDAGSLKAIPGVGLKTARRLILELKEKLSDFEESLTGKREDTASSSSGKQSLREEALLALTSLGFSREEVEAVVGRVLADADKEEVTTEVVVRRTLQLMAKGS